MALFRRQGDQDRWDQSQRRFRQPEYEGTYSEDARRARPGERGLGWARRRDIDDRMSQQAAPRGGGRYDRSGEERYAEGLEDFEQHEGYRGPSGSRWEMDEGGVQFGGPRGTQRGGELYGSEAGGYRQGEYGRSGGYGSGFGQDEYGRGGFGERGGYGRAESSDYGRGFYGGGAFGSRSEYGEYGRGGWSGSHDERSGRFRGMGPRGYQRSDERIREDVCDLLTDDDEIDASDISIDVSAGVVVLTGTVDHRETKRRAEDVAEGVSGVHEVQNNLRVASQSGGQRDYQHRDQETQRGTLGSQQNAGAQTIDLGQSGHGQSGMSSGHLGASAAQASSTSGQSATAGSSQSTTAGDKSRR